MLCPMKFNGSAKDARTYSKRVCEKEKCAWWVEKNIYKTEELKANDGVLVQRQSDVINEKLSSGCSLKMLAEK